MLQMAERMLREGAAILRRRGASTKPGQPLIMPDKELERVMPVVHAISKSFPETWLSIDTYNAKMAAEAVAAGVSLVNDIEEQRKV